MEHSTSELCDIYLDQVDVVEPVFNSFGGHDEFCGQIKTVKCFECKGVLQKLVNQNGQGKVLLVDGGGSLRRALVDIEMASLAEENGWVGIVLRCRARCR